VHALIERDLRRAMAADSIASLPLYHEDRACAAPTAARVFELLEPLRSTAIFHVGELLALSPPTLEPLQLRILTFFKVPHRAYRTACRALGDSC